MIGESPSTTPPRTSETSKHTISLGSCRHCHYRSSRNSFRSSSSYACFSASFIRTTSSESRHQNPETHLSASRGSDPAGYK